ncbi:MAG: hypothetical protein M3248_03585 [Actinomycetota bacterium]|nr:hypothetical protein [Actinomycetota bacterium]
MDDRPQDDRTEDRRRRGPLGDEEGDAATRRISPEEDAATRPISPEEAERESPTSDFEQTSRMGPAEDDPETRLIRTPGTHSDDATLYPGGYPEAPELREAHLREIYGGVDWLASFIGCVFALVCGGILLSFSSLVLGLLGLPLNLESQQVDTAMITGLVVIGLVLFVSYFLGGYVAGRLARFDGGRNGAATVLWGILLTVILALFYGFLPPPLFGLLQEFVQDSIRPAVSSLIEAGLAGLGIVVGVLLLELLGGFLGGRLGNNYHTRIDHTS